MKIPTVTHALTGAIFALVASLVSWIPWTHIETESDQSWRQTAIVAAFLLGLSVLMLAIDMYFRKATEDASFNRQIHVAPATIGVISVTVGLCGLQLLPRHTWPLIAEIVLLALIVQITVAVFAHRDYISLVALMALAVTGAALWLPPGWVALLIGTIAAVGILAATLVITEAPARKHVLTAVGIIGIIVSVLAVLVPARSSVHAWAAARTVPTELEVLHDGTNYTGISPILYSPSAIAVSNSGTSAVYSKLGQSTYGLWLFSPSRADLAWSSTGQTTPNGRELASTEGDDEYAQNLSVLLSPHAQKDVIAEITGTTDLAFEQETLYGVTSTEMWQFTEGDFPRSIHRWTDSRMRRLAVISPNTAAVISTNEDLRSEIHFVELGTGKVSEAVHIDGVEGRDLQETARRPEQPGYVGPARSGVGTFLVLVGNEVHEVTSDGSHSHVVTLDFGKYTDPFGQIAATEDLLAFQGKHTLLARGYRENMSWSPAFQPGIELACGPQQVQTSLPTTNVRDISFSSDGSTVELLQSPTPTAICTYLRWTASADEKLEWEPKSRVQSNTPSAQQDGRRFLGVVSNPTSTGPSMLAPISDTVVSDDPDGEFQLQKIPKRDKLFDFVRGFDVLGTTRWYAGRFEVDQQDGGAEPGWVLLSEDDNAVTVHTAVGNVRDIAALSETTVILARCESIDIFDSASSEISPIVSREAIRTDCEGKLDLGAENTWAAQIGIPQAIAPRTTDGVELIYVADTKINADATRGWFGVTVINRQTGAVAPLPGGDLTRLRAAPIDIAVSTSGNVCVATVHTNRPGPLVVILNGRARVVETHGRNITGCAWDDNRLLATTDRGEFLAFTSDAFSAGSPGFVPQD